MPGIPVMRGELKKLRNDLNARKNRSGDTLTLVVATVEFYPNTIELTFAESDLNLKGQACASENMSTDNEQLYQVRERNIAVQIES